MKIILIITALIIVLYFAYPLWLILISSGKKNKFSLKNNTDEVSLILLIYNGKEFLEEKIKTILAELEDIPNHEFIIIDDNSTDGSREILSKYNDNHGITLILKDEHQGIPHTMNMAVKLAKYEQIVFCDQRQAPAEHFLEKVIQPLGDEDVVAVSACISEQDKSGFSSAMRRYENYLKVLETGAGSLMGVYGPLYAIRRKHYTPIPDGIILDDLYLSLNMMKAGKIRMAETCFIYDEDIYSLHDYRRIKRYLKGFVQILTEPGLLRKLPARQLFMLLWHKYLRLLIPVMLCLCYFATGIQALYHPAYLIAFIILTVTGIASLVPAISKHRNLMVNFVRLNVLYALAMGEMLIHFSFSIFH
jgi:poly-beta-1,6-N-acetyl-D-glucosamine synthase